MSAAGRHQAAPATSGNGPWAMAASRPRPIDLGHQAEDRDAGVQPRPRYTLSRAPAAFEREIVACAGLPADGLIVHVTPHTSANSRSTRWQESVGVTAAGFPPLVADDDNPAARARAGQAWNRTTVLPATARLVKCSRSTCEGRVPDLLEKR